MQCKCQDEIDYTVSCWQILFAAWSGSSEYDAILSGSSIKVTKCRWRNWPRYASAHASNPPMGKFVCAQRNLRACMLRPADPSPQNSCIRHNFGPWSTDIISFIVSLVVIHDGSTPPFISNAHFLAPQLSTVYPLGHHLPQELLHSDQLYMRTPERWHAYQGKITLINDTCTFLGEFRAALRKFGAFQGFFRLLLTAFALHNSTICTRPRYMSYLHAHAHFTNRVYTRCKVYNMITRCDIISKKKFLPSSVRSPDYRPMLKYMLQLLLQLVTSTCETPLEVPRKRLCIAPTRWDHVSRFSYLVFTAWAIVLHLQIGLLALDPTHFHNRVVLYYYCIWDTVRENYTNMMEYPLYLWFAKDWDFCIRKS